MNEIEILQRSIRDFFSSKMLKLALIPLFITMLILYMLFFGVASVGIETLKTVAETSQAGGEVVIDENANFIAAVCRKPGIYFTKLRLPVTVQHKNILIF